MASDGHKSEIRTRLTIKGHRTFLTCTCGELDVEVPQGASVDFPIAKYAAHAFEMAIQGKLGAQAGRVQLMEDNPPQLG